VGPFLGGILYFYLGKTSTFLIFALVSLIDGCKLLNDAVIFLIVLSLYSVLRLSMTGGPTASGKSIEHGGDKVNVSAATLLCDPYILLLIGNSAFSFPPKEVALFPLATLFPPSSRYFFVVNSMKV
jgi:hypothetical protein